MRRLRLNTKNLKQSAWIDVVTLVVNEQNV